GLTGLRYMTQPTSQRQQPRYNQRVPRNPQANAGQRTAGSGARRSDPGALVDGGHVLTELPRGRRFELALRDLVEEGLVADLQDAGGFGAVPLDALEHIREGLPLGLVRPTPSDLSQAFRAERTGEQRGRPHLPAAGWEIREHLLAIRQHHEPPDDVLELAHVAAPGILQKSGRRLGRQLLVSPVLLVELLEEARGKGEDLLLTLSQRGN